MKLIVWFSWMVQRKKWNMEIVKANLRKKKKQILLYWNRLRKLLSINIFKAIENGLTLLATICTWKWDRSYFVHRLLLCKSWQWMIVLLAFHQRFLCFSIELVGENKETSNRLKKNQRNRICNRWKRASYQ